MKILQVITKGETGGAQTHLLELCRALNGRVQISVVIGGSHSHSGFVQDLATLNASPRNLPELENSLSPLRALRAALVLADFLRKDRPDLIHAHSSMAGVVARIAGRITGIPVVYTVHGFGFKPQAPRLQRWAALAMEWMLARWTARMICVSKHESELARRLPLPPDRIHIVRNAIQDSARRARPQEEPMRVIMVARCAAPKRQDLLLEALQEAGTRLGRPIPATFVGGGPQLPALQQQARTLGLQHIAFTGDVDDVAGLLQQHGLFVLLSDHEGLPVSVIEAMRAGLPVLCSDLPGLHELIEHGRAGWLVPNDPQQVALTLVRLAHAPDERARAGHAARLRYETDSTPGAMAAAVLAVYGQIIRHEPRVSA